MQHSMMGTRSDNTEFDGIRVYGSQLYTHTLLPGAVDWQTPCPATYKVRARVAPGRWISGRKLSSRPCAWSMTPSRPSVSSTGACDSVDRYAFHATCAQCRGT